MKPLTPQEVRLGNLTSHGVVVGVFNNSFDVESQTGEWYSLHDCNIYPVPLTPEILEGFGFEHQYPFGFVKDDKLYCLDLYKNGIKYISANPEKGIELCRLNGEHILLPEIKHAHTLQNFIHAISGVELVYNNKLEQR